MYDLEAYYRVNYGNGNFGLCTELRDVGLIPPYPGQYWVGWGYGFSCTLTTRSDDFPTRFTFTAFPMTVGGKRGKYSYRIDSRCQIRREDYSNGQMATDVSPILETCFPYVAANNEPNVIRRIRAIASAQETYKSTYGAGNYASTLSQLSDAGLIEPVINGMIEYNQIALSAEPSTATMPSTFKILVSPRNYYRESGIRSFYLDQTGVLRGADHQGTDAGADDPPVLVERIPDPKSEIQLLFN